MNDDIREMMRSAGVRQWQVADAYGLHESNFVRLLRHELTTEQRQRVEAAIEQCKSMA